ncbi:MAG TPA: PA14 domain-containing protein, partial [Planctomycetota bacterium]|nr:PA14 domain-containing protein [Planctomycetota bacterium]
MKHLVLLIGFLGSSTAFADDQSGEQIYAKKCLSCHGKNGEGSKDHPELLIGDRSLEKLTAYVARSMPEDKPGTCVGEEAKKVSAYIYDAFYSRAAQARNKPPRIELARLTVGQFRNAIADLVASFKETPKPDERRGLHAEYFNAKRPKDDKRVVDRIDPVVDAVFPADGPTPEVKGEEFSGRWTGTLLAPETGLYEFNLESVNGARLFINSPDQPLVDAWVRSGDEKAHRETVYLLAGRLYPVKIEFFKEKKEKAASVALKWKLADRVEEVVPQDYLSPGRASDALILRTAFPPDDKSMGYERGNLVSKAWDEATTEAALEVAGYVVSHLRSLSGVGLEAPDAKTKLPAFCRKFTERAFRRPLTPEQAPFFIDRPFAQSKDLEAAVKKCVLLALKSPRFLYREVGGAEPDQ